jgi:hypothetical protein
MHQVFIEGGLIRKLWGVETHAYRDHLLGDFLLTLDIHAPIADSCTAAKSIPPVHCWDIRQRVREAGIAKDMPNKSFGRIAELKFGPDNGPRFFGLRDRQPSQVRPPARPAMT